MGASARWAYSRRKAVRVRDLDLISVAVPVAGCRPPRAADHCPGGDGEDRLSFAALRVDSLVQARITITIALARVEVFVPGAPL